MMKRLIKIGVFVSLAVVVFVAYSVMMFCLPVYHYESSDRGFAEIEIPWKGRGLDTVQKLFEIYKKKKGNEDLRLLRTSKRIWSSPNLWWDNLTNPRWEIPYAEPSPKPNHGWHLQREINPD